MSKVKSGVTILLNKVSNCTFIANDTDEEIQTSTRDCDSHIDWAGELNIPVCEYQYKKISHKLWDLLDDIDTASDMFKPSVENENSYKLFYEYAMRKSEERHIYLTSDGYKLERNISPEPSLE